MNLDLARFFQDSPLLWLLLPAPVLLLLLLLVHVLLSVLVLTLFLQLKHNVEHELIPIRPMATRLCRNSLN